MNFIFIFNNETHTIWFLYNWKNKNVFNAKVFNYHSIRWRWRCWGRLSFTGINSLYLIITRRLFHHLLLPLTGITMSLISLFLLIPYLLSQMLVAVGLSRRRLFTAPPPVGSGASLALSILLPHQDIDSEWLLHWAPFYFYFCFIEVRIVLN